MPAVTLKGVSKKYRISRSRQEVLKETLSFGKVKRSHDFWALQDIDLEVQPGTTLGVLGRNGAGKSTLLRIISGVVQPTAGTVEVNGRLAALFGVGAGFNPEFTGRENVMLNGLLLGIARDEMFERFGDIAAFADIGEFMDQPVKTYSSGMRSRLGFAVAVNVEPDILVVDETLSVGDAVFKQAALQRMYDLRDSGTTILFVSHSMGMVKNFCTEAVLLHKGRLVASGGTRETLDRYQALISSAKAQKSARTADSDRQMQYMIEHEEEEDLKEDFDPNDKRSPSLRHGTGEARIQHVELLDGNRKPISAVPSGSTLTVRVNLQYIKDVEDSNLSITLRNKAGLDIFSTSTTLEQTPLGERNAGERVTVDFTFDAPLQPGTYDVSAAVSPYRSKNLYLDRVDMAAVFKVTRSENGRPVKGLVQLPAKVTIFEPEQTRNSEQPA